MADSLFHSLSTDADWKEALDESEERPILVFKHSSSCPISADAQTEVSALAESSDVPIYRVVVQKSRDVSNAIEDTLGIRHETPQAILVQDREPVFDTSHFNISVETLQKELLRVSET